MSPSYWYHNLVPVKGKADDLYRGSMQFVNHRRTALQTPLVTGPYAAANNTALLAWKPSQGIKLYCMVNRGTLGVNNLPRVVARIMPRSESNPRPLDHESNAQPLHHRVTSIDANLSCMLVPETWTETWVVCHGPEKTLKSRTVENVVCVLWSVDD